MWKALILVIFIAGCSYTTGQYTSSRETYVEQQPEAREPATDEAGESEIGKYSADSNSESSTNLEVQDNDSSPTQFIRVQDERIPEIVEVASDGSAPNQIDVGVSGSTQIDVNGGVPVVDDSYSSQQNYASFEQQADQAPVFLQTANDANPSELTDAGQEPEALPQPELLVQQPLIRHPLHYIPQEHQPAQLVRPVQQQQEPEAQALQLRVLDAGQPQAVAYQQQQQPQVLAYQQPQTVVYQHQQPIASAPETTAANSGEVHIVNGNQATIRALHDTLVNRVLAKQQQAIQQQTIAQVQTTSNVQQQAQPVAVAKSLHQSRSKPGRNSGRGGYASLVQPKPVLTSPVNSVMATRDLQIVRTGLGRDYQQQQQPQVQPVYNSVSPSAAPISADQLSQLQNAGYEIVRFQQPQSKVLVQQSILTPETYDETPGNPQQTVVQTLAGPTTTELMSQIGYTAVQDTPRYTVYKVKDTSDPEQNSVSTSRLQYVGQQDQGYQQQQQQHYQQPQVSAAKAKEYQEIQARQRNREQEQLQQQNQQQEQLQQDQLQQAQLKQQQQQILRKQAKLRQEQQQSQQQAQLQQRNLVQQQRDIEQQQRDLQLRLHHKQQVQQKLQLQQQQQQLARSKIDFINPNEQSGQVTFNTPFAPTGVKQQVVYKSSVDPDYYNAVKAKLMHTFAQMNYLHQAYPYFNPYASPYGPRPDVGLQFNPYARGQLFGQPQLPYRPDFNPYYRPELFSARPDPFRGPPYPPRQSVPAEPLHTAGSKIISELPPLLKAASLGNKLSGRPPPPKHALESPLFSSKTVDVEYAPGVDLGFDEAAYAAEQARRLGGPAFIDPGHIQPSIGFKLNEETAKFEQLPPTREIYKYQHKEFLEFGTKIPSPPPPSPPVPTSAAPVPVPRPVYRENTEVAPVPRPVYRENTEVAPVPRPVYRENTEVAPVPRPSYHAHPEPSLQQPKFTSVPYLNSLPNPSNSPNFRRYSPLNININGSPYPHHHQPQINPGRVEVNAIDPEQKPALPHHLLAQLLRATTGEELELEQY